MSASGWGGEGPVIGGQDAVAEINAVIICADPDDTSFIGVKSEERAPIPYEVF